MIVSMADAKGARTNIWVEVAADAVEHEIDRLRADGWLTEFEYFDLPREVQVRVPGVYGRTQGPSSRRRPGGVRRYYLILHHFRGQPPAILEGRDEP
jgi:hypothetical protein